MGALNGLLYSSLSFLMLLLCTFMHVCKTEVIEKKCKNVEERKSHHRIKIRNLRLSLFLSVICIAKDTKK